MIVVALMVTVSALLCGDPESTCYSVLGVERNATRSQIRKAYYGHSRTLHPDRNDAEDAAERFAAVATAYDTLYDNESRTEYDDLLSNSGKYYARIFKEYGSQYMAKHTATSIWVVLFGSLVIITIGDIVFRRSRYFDLRNRLKSHPDVLRRVTKLRKETGRSGKGKSVRDMPVSDEELDKVAEVSGSELPTLSSTVPVRLIRLPWECVLLVSWAASWVYRFWILKHPYGQDEREYLTRSILQLSALNWENMSEDSRNSLVARELWITKNYETYTVEERRKYSRRRNWE